MILAGAVLTAVVLTAAPLAAGATTPAPSPPPIDAKAYLINHNPSIVDAATEPPNQALWGNTVDPALTTLVNEFPDIVGKAVWDEKSGTSTINYYTGADPTQEAAFLAAARQIDALVPPSLKLVWKPVTWDNKARSALLQEITSNPEKWTSYFGSAPQSGYVETDGNIHVSLADPSKVSSAPAKSGVLPDGSPFVADGPSKADWQVGRTTDVSPWTAGDYITAGPYFCTSGFNWTKWGTNEKMGMTAAHCAVTAGTLTWNTNNGGPWGTGVQSDPGRDALLVRAATGTSFNTATVWVGPSDIRAVTSAKGVPQIGDVVALSGAASGLGAAGSVIKTDYMANGIGPINLVTYSGCLDGDSGGPWLQTEYGTGNVKAFGQHEGRFLYNGVFYCGFMPLNAISAALDASLLLAP